MDKTQRGDRPPADDCHIVEAARRVSAEISKGAAARDLERRNPDNEMDLVRSYGIQAARTPAGYGGRETDYADYAEIMLWLARGDPNIAQCLQPHFVLMDWLKIEGTEEQRKRYYRQVVYGAVITNAVAERGTRTPGDFAVRLETSGSSFRLNGSKFYCTGSLIAEGLYVLCVADDGTMAVAIVPKDRAGISVTDDWDGMGQRTTGSGTIVFESVVVEPNEVMWLRSWGKKRSYLGAAAQVAHAAIDAGIALAALDDAIVYGRDKARPVIESGVERAADDPYVVHAVGEMSVLARSAEAMVLRAARILDRATGAGGGTYAHSDAAYIEASVAVAEAKAASNDASLRVSEMMYRVAGASSTLRKYNFDRHWRNARTHTLHDPVTYKYKAIGNHLLTGTPPPISTKI